MRSLTTRTEAVERLNQEITKEIHERRVIEEHLRTAQTQLEQRIAERTADLAQANARLQQEVREHRLTEARGSRVKNASTISPTTSTKECGSRVPNRRKSST